MPSDAVCSGETRFFWPFWPFWPFWLRRVENKARAAQAQDANADANANAKSRAYSDDSGLAARLVRSREELKWPV